MEKKTLIGVIRKWSDDQYLFGFTIEKGYSRFEFTRSSIYSISTSLILLFLTKADSLNWYSWAGLVIAIVFALKAVNNFTSLALLLKEAHDNYAKEKKQSLGITVFVEKELQSKSKEIAVFLRRGTAYCFLIASIVILSFLANRFFKTDSTSPVLADHLRRHRETDSLAIEKSKILTSRLDTVEKLLKESNNKLDSLISKKCK